MIDMWPFQGKTSTSLAENTCLATAIGKIPFGAGIVSKTFGTLKHRRKYFFILLL